MRRICSPAIETRLLVSDKDGAIVVTNHTREDISKADFAVRMTGVKSVVSVESGPVEFKELDGKVSFSVPVRTTDIILLKE